MNNFIFENSSKVYFGEGCVKEYLSNILSAYGDTVMLCYGGGSIKKNGIYDEVITVLKKENKAVVEFSGIPSNPTYSKVLEGVKLAKESNADLILAVGGGSVMDCCKAISLGAKYDGDIWADFWARLGVIDFELLPLGIIVTVSGTGSECNGGAVITNEEKKIKTGRDYPKCNPKFAIMDPEYTFSVPKLQTASGGFDILSHIMETYFSKTDDDNVSDDISEALMKSIIKNLSAALENPKDYIARSNLMWDSAMAENGILKCGRQTDFQVHQIEHQLGAFTDCNHGQGLAVIQPVYCYHILNDAREKLTRFAQVVFGQKTAEEGLEALQNFIKECHLPTTLPELKSKVEITNDLLKKVADTTNLIKTNPRTLTKEEVYDILLECM